MYLKYRLSKFTSLHTDLSHSALWAAIWIMEPVRNTEEGLVGDCASPWILYMFLNTKFRYQRSSPSHIRAYEAVPTCSQKSYKIKP